MKFKHSLFLFLITCTALPIAFSCNKNTITITFNANGGVISGDNKVTVNKGTMYKNLNKPTATKSGFRFDNYYTFDAEGQRQIAENYSFDNDTTIYAHFTKDTASFEFDTWSNVIDSINNGESDLRNRYGLNSIDQLVGKKRNIKINDIEYETVVIGAKHDDIAKAYNKRALLTFQITNIDKNSRYHNGNNSYLASKIRNACTSIFESINDSKIKENIKEVKKKTYIGGGAGKKVIDYDEKLFVLSMSEIGENNQFSPAEEDTYKYYSDKDKTKRSKNSWLRTPSNVNEDDVYYIDGNGALNVTNDSTSYRNCNPCFALGEINYANEEFYHANWHDIISLANTSGLQGLKDKFNVNSFIGYTHPLQVKDKYYTVRVIGENEDLLANVAANNKYAALTFMFTESVFTSKYTTTSYNNWATSKIKDDLKNLYPYFDSEVSSELKDVVRYTYVGDTLYEKKLKIDNEKLSIPSAIELGIKDSELSGEPRTNILNEGHTYSYFLNNIGDIDLANRRNVKLSPNVNSYYLRSCNTLNTSTVLTIKDNFTVADSNVDNELDVVPIFSIGASTIDNTKITCFSNSIDSTYGDLQSIRIKNSDNYITHFNLKYSYSSHNEIASPKIILKGDNNKYIVLDNNDYSYSSNNTLTLNSINTLKEKYKSNVTLINEIIIIPEVKIKDESWGDILSNKNLGYYPIGAYKSITFDNNTYNARIIGINEDIIPTTNDYASLTFMIDSPIKDNNQILISQDYYGDNFTAKWSVDDSAESALKSKYDEFKVKINGVIGNNAIKTIKKSTKYFDYNSSQTEVGTLESSNNTVFPLSYDEVFSNITNSRYSYFRNNYSYISFVSNSSYKFLFRDTDLFLDAATKSTRFRLIDNNAEFSYVDVNSSSTDKPNGNLLLCFAI